MKIWDYSLLPQQIAEAQSQPFPLHWLSQMQYTKQRHSFLNLQTKPEGPKKQRKKQDKEKPDQPIYNNNQSRGEKTIYRPLMAIHKSNEKMWLLADFLKTLHG